MADGAWRFISTTRVPVEEDFILFIGHQHFMDSRLEQEFLLIGRLFFYALASRDRGDGGRGIVPGRRTAQGCRAGLQIFPVLFKTAKINRQGSGGFRALIRDKGNDGRDALVNIHDLLINGTGFGSVIFVGSVGIAVCHKTGRFDGFSAGGSHILQNCKDGILEALQTGRTGAFCAAGVITLHRSISVLSTVIERHQSTAGGTIDEAGERIDLPGVINGSGAL